MATYCVLRQLRLRSHVLPQHWILKALPLNGSLGTSIHVLSHKEFHTTSVSNVNHRKERAIVKHLYYRNHEKTLKHSYSPIVELPDYTYIDGRPTEMTLSYKEKQEKNYNLAKQVVKLVNEVKFSQGELSRQQEAKAQYGLNRKKSGLKEKGQKV